MEMIENIYRFQNGMVMVFDEKGQQMPEYQGLWKEMKEKIMRNKPEHIEIESKIWK